MQKTLTESPNESGVVIAGHQTARTSHESSETDSNSTLIEFPGARNIPEWRKRLSQRVREVQEQKAREAAEVDAAQREAEAVSCALPSGQLELVPDPEQAPLNPIVTKALERVDRARRAEHLSTGFRSTAAAAALAPIEEALPENVETPETKPKLTIVTPVTAPQLEELESDASPQAALVSASEDVTERPRRVGVISATVEEAALSYLDTCLAAPAHLSDTRSNTASLTRRTFVGLLDLLFITLMILPVAAAFQAASADWSDPRVMASMSGIAALTMFVYFTISIGLTGRTLAMRVLSVRTIDERTGLIPSGGQSIKRALGYIFSLAIAGLGLAYAFIDREHRTLHDRLSKTIVVRA